MMDSFKRRNTLWVELWYEFLRLSNNKRGWENEWVKN